MEHGLLPLPGPESQELRNLLRTAELRRIYAFLYARRANPPTKVEIVEHLESETGKSQSQRDRRIRELYHHFDIEKVGSRRSPQYLLRGTRVWMPLSASGRISRRVRAQVLQPQRCAMCGRTPLGHGVVLVVDHKLPQAWGGTNDPENLQPLCEDCNLGKKDHFRTFEAFSEQIRLAADYAEPQRRIGELFLAFGEDEWIESELLSAVANAKEPQEDWQRRMRDLRFIGWDYRFKTKKERGRVRSYYQLTRSAPWPSNIIQAIKAEELRRKSG